MEKNCTSSEKAVTTSETAMEYTMNSCTKIVSNNSRLYDVTLRILGNQEIRVKGNEDSNYKLSTQFFY